MRKLFSFLIVLMMMFFIACNEEVEFKISYNLDGGICENLVEVYKEGETVTLPTPTKDGYVFIGWFENDVVVEVITDGDHKVVARWEKVKENEKDPEQPKDPLEEAKTKNKEALEKFVKNYFEESDYSENGWNKIQEELANGLEAIKNAKSIEEADNALSAAKNACNEVLTIYDEEDLALANAKEEALKEIEEIKGSLVEEEFNSVDLIRINYYIEEALVLIPEYETIEEIEESVKKIKDYIDNAERIYYINYKNIDNENCNYTYFGYKSYDEVVNEFAKDYKTYTGLDLSKWNGSTADTLKVFTESKDKWWWLLDYWASVNKCTYNGLSSAKVFTMLKENKVASAIAPDYYYCISTEAEGFINKTCVSVYGGSMVCADYTNEEVRSTILNFMRPKNTYNPGETYVFPTPTREFQTFEGWYLTSDFSGEAITGITNDMVGSINVYAKWSELSVEDQFKLNIRVAQEELKNYIKGFKKEDYSATAWKKVEDTMNAGITTLLTATDDATLKVLLDTEKAKLDAITPTRFNVTYKLNGGNWDFSNYDEIIVAFLKEYSAFKGSSVDAESFFEVSYTVGTTDKSIDTFFIKNPKWQWMLTYFQDIAPEDKKAAYKLESVTFAQLRTEIQAFLMKTKRINAGYESDDFSNAALTDNVLSYIVLENYEYLEEVINLPIPLKKGYTFKGWYSDESFQNQVTKVTNKITLYAKWETTTSEELLQIAINENKANFTKYFNEIDKSKYNDAAWALKEKAYEDGLKALSEVSSMDLLSEEYTKQIAALDAVKETIYTVTYKLDGGHWLYSTHEEIVTAFLADYNKFRERTDITKVGFFDFSWTVDASKDIKSFFIANPQWNWILDYITYVVGEDSATKFDIATLDVPQTRIELEGILNKAAVVNSSTNYASKDYSSEEVINKIFDFISYEEIEYNDVVVELPTPIKEGYTFAGWYSEESLTNKVESVSEAKVLYAKWMLND